MKIAHPDELMVGCRWTLQIVYRVQLQWRGLNSSSALPKEEICSLLSVSNWLKHKATWIHPRSKHGHMIDYILTRRNDLRDVCNVRVLRSADGDTDHKMVRGKFKLCVRKKTRLTGVEVPKRINVTKLKDPEACASLIAKMSTIVFDDSWKNFKDQVYATGVEILGLKKAIHRDWFDDNDQEIKDLLQTKKILFAICAQLIGGYEQSCGFENGLCPGWYQSSFDDFNWSRRSGSTWSSLTGPSSGNGGYGFYMYIETSLPRSYGDKAKLLFSPPSSVIGTISCLKFYYHMYGATINRLNVLNGYSIVFTKSGQQGNRWRYAEVTVFVQNTISFEGITGSSFTGDIAIDDVSLTHGICTGCQHTLNDSFGHLDITLRMKETQTESFYGALQVSSEHKSFCRSCLPVDNNSRRTSLQEDKIDYIKVWDGSGSLVFTRVGCQSNYTARMCLEIAFQNSQNVTIQVSLNNYQSHARVSHGIIKDGLGAGKEYRQLLQCQKETSYFSFKRLFIITSLLAGWNVTIENKTSDSLQLRWRDINHRLNGGIRFFVVTAKSSYGSVPVRKLFSPNITSAKIRELDPYTEYNVSVVAIDGNGSPFQSTFLQARTDEGGKENESCCFQALKIVLKNKLSTEQSDYLRISDGSNRIVGTYCGYQTNKRVSVDGSIAVLTFHTDGSVRYRGFYLTFSFSPRSRVCGFENGLCPGWHQSYFDEFNWSRRSGSTSSSLTGPSTGHGGYGFYMYIETSSPRSYGDKAILSFSPPGLFGIRKVSCLKFYYHMYGATINRLNVFNGSSIVFTKSGQQGNRWLYAEVTVFVQNTVSSILNRRQYSPNNNNPCLNFIIRMDGEVRKAGVAD
ncbi:MAM and fibronectin type III domain-containing protein 1 [Acropora cervicornis]|uniref:MAM and fibronectin type III domain-containing protein 1 n=1 Tax=Acropora cervicornis TaxID=6130 RepID=A0AAD9QID0_ACRCE|nr:MAM and fibronectin type III domain-containing protein 1 [Acropora cervicornis]